MNELDQEAWDRWVAFRKAIRKPIKTVSEQAMKIKLQRYGTDQAAVVDQSIANQWQGLFDLQEGKASAGREAAKKRSCKSRQTKCGSRKTATGPQASGTSMGCRTHLANFAWSRRLWRGTRCDRKSTATSSAWNGFANGRGSCCAMLRRATLLVTCASSAWCGRCLVSAG
jgi:hypothetical protein